MTPGNKGRRKLYFTAPGVGDTIKLTLSPVVTMSYFPVFMDLHDKPVLVVGGGKVAARKVRALLKAQAAITVVAPELDSALNTACNAGQIEWLQAPFTQAHLEGAWLVFAATNDPELNREVFRAGEARNIPVNVVDDGAHCRFISPAVIDRHPVQVAVSTGGGSPMMARAVRGWIERILPQGLGKVAEAASRLRKTLGAGQTMKERRERWGFLLDRSRSVAWSLQEPGAIERSMTRAFKRRAAQPANGKVYLVGAGPGRPELLTLRALEVLQQADVILHDRLVPEAILDSARRDADRIDVGKRAGDQPGQQTRIFHLMVELARAGKTVIRLKGGDAFVFGRGGEELQHLRANGVEYEVVPGITAALGCAAYAGIPLTHRDLAQEVTFTTGHLADPASSPDTPPESPSVPGRTKVIYMGLKQAPVVRKSLLAEGYPPWTPAALVIGGTMDTQRVLFGRLATLPAMAAKVTDRAPALFIIGEVASLGEQLAWFGQQPALEVAA